MRWPTFLMLMAFAATGCGVSQDEEVQLGARNAEQLNEQLPIVQDEAIVEYINALGDRIAQQTTRSGLDWHFYVVNASEANAFALPGGFIYVNRGLIDLTSNESELAGAVAHEIGHVVERHAIQQMQQKEGANLGVTAVCMLTNVCNSSLGQVAIQVGGAVAFARYSREDEAEADSEAVVNTVRAGIDPRGVPSLFAALLRERQAQPDVVSGWFADHPLEESRIEKTRALIQTLGLSDASGLETSSREYETMRELLDHVPAPPPARPREAGEQRLDGTTTGSKVNGH